MGTPAPRTVNLVVFGVLFTLGLAFYGIFVLPRWWVLTGDIPSSLATAGRIAAGIPFGLSALPVLRILQSGLNSKPRAPELALRLLAWSAILLVTAGVLILLTSIVEIWLSLTAGGPWLSAVYGAAGAIALLGVLALRLSFVAAQPPKPPKPAEPAESDEAAPDLGEAKKPTTKRGRAARRAAAEPVENPESTEAPEAPEPDSGVDSDLTTEDAPESDEAGSGTLRNKRPTSKRQKRRPAETS